MSTPPKKVLIGLYLSCALVYFAFNADRITADSSKHKTTHQLQAMNLAGESLLFPFFLAYHELYLDGQAPPVSPRL